MMFEIEPAVGMAVVIGLILGYGLRRQHKRQRHFSLAELKRGVWYTTVSREPTWAADPEIEGCFSFVQGPAKNVLVVVTHEKLPPLWKLQGFWQRRIVPVQKP